MMSNAISLAICNSSAYGQCSTLNSRQSIQVNTNTNFKKAITEYSFLVVKK